MTDYLLLETGGSDYLLTEASDQIEIEYLEAGWHVWVDWGKNGNYHDERWRLKSLSIRRGRDGTLSSSRYERVRPGECVIELDNYDRRFDPFYASGPLYRYVKPDRPIYVQYSYGDPLLTRTVFTGRISDIIPNGQDKTVRIQASDGMDILEQQYCSLGSLQTDITVADAIETLLSDAGFPYIEDEATFPLTFPVTLGSSQVEDNGDVIPYWFSDYRVRVLDAIDELSQAFMGEYFVDSGGTFVYNARSYEANPVATLLQSQLGKDLELEAPWNDVRNVVRVTGHPLLSSTAGSELWKLGHVPALISGVTLTLWAEFSFDGVECAASLLVAPAATTDYLAFSAADGSGSNLTTRIAVTKTDYANVSKLEILYTATGGDPTTAYLTLLKLRGTALYNLSGTTAEATDSDSIADFGRRGLTVSSPWLQNTQHIQDHADWALLLFKNERKRLRLRLEKRPELAMGLDLFDYVALEIDYLGITGDYSVTEIQHEWRERGGTVTSLRLEPGPQLIVPDLFILPATFGERLGW